jgi:exopolyphosphatase/guanosine-5'-triphosphate,3'-diphosphate pyrophosphatase
MTPLVEESLSLRARYDEEPSHSDHVAMLALQIFDGLRPWHGLGARDRELLHSAALLHDIGWSQTPDGKGHHKWSARLIQGHAWKELEAEEVAVVTQVARYHRKVPPQPEHAEFQALPKAAQRRVMVLGGILRIADGLDRTHTGKVERVEAMVTPAALMIKVIATGSWEAERVMFEIKRDMLCLVAERPVTVEKS